MVSSERTYDLEERLIAYAAMVIELTESLPDTRTGTHIAGQLLRSGTSPAPNYAEAQGGESGKDFVHKMAVCLKELRESNVWLRIIGRRELICNAKLAPLLAETGELIRIFKASIATAKRNGEKKGRSRKQREDNDKSEC